MKNNTQHTDEMRADGCKCSMRIRLTGDGCRYCNPQEYIDWLHEQIEEIASAEAKCKEILANRIWQCSEDGTVTQIKCEGCASAEARYLPVIEKLVGQLHLARQYMLEVKHFKEHRESVDEALALATPLLKGEK